MSDNENKKKGLNLYIYEYIKQNQRLPPHKDSEKSKYSYHCRQLKEKGLIENISYGVWIAKEVQKKVTTIKGKTKRKRCRSHAYRFVVKVPYITGWEEIGNVLQRRKLNPRSIPQGYAVTIKRHTVWVCKETIQVIFYKGKSFKGVSAEDGDKCAICELNATLKALENKLRVNLRFGKAWQYRCVSKHHADIKNEIAKYHQSRGVNKWEIRDSEGTLWLLMDNSFNLHEVETVHAPTATHDMDVVVAPLMNTLRSNPNILNDLMETIRGLTDAQKTQIEIQNNQMESQKESFEQIRSLAYLMQEHIKTKH